MTRLGELRDGSRIEDGEVYPPEEAEAPMSPHKPRPLERKIHPGWAKILKEEEAVSFDEFPTLSRIQQQTGWDPYDDEPTDPEVLERYIRALEANVAAQDLVRRQK